MINHIIVSKASFEDLDENAIVLSNVHVTDGFLRNFIRREELFPDALKSYYINQYCGYMASGGFAEFVYRTGWEKVMISALVTGLEDMRAQSHLDLLVKFTQQLNTFGAEGVQCLYDDGHPQNQQMRDFLNQLIPEFKAMNEQENLTTINAHWLKQHPNLVVMSDSDIMKQIAISAKAVPDRQQRIAEALELEPRELKIIRLLCNSVNLDFIGVTSTNTEKRTKPGAASRWNFRTVQGDFYLVDKKTEAAIFNASTHAEVASVIVEDVIAG
jgi:hypothetical protein